MKSIYLLVTLMLIAVPAQAQEDDHGHLHRAASASAGDESRDEHDHAAHAVELNSAQLEQGEIETLVVREQPFAEVIEVPGEVVINRYRTSDVTPRVGAQITARHVRLGDHVHKGQALVTLSSVEMAEAQGALLEADTDWRRVQSLGRKVVSEKRFIAAQLAYQQAHAQVRAYGMSDAQIKRMIREGDAARADGRFELLAPQDGTVISDAFVLGQISAPGQLLLRITDESRIWVEARLPAHSAEQLLKDAAATVSVGEARLTGRVVQIHHMLDASTRTQAVYVELDNPNHQLHPGQFVAVAIDTGATESGIVVPLAAVLRGADGDWQVFVETAPGRYEPREVELLRTSGEQALIEGLDPGTAVVGKGAFFVQSELAKGGFEVHRH